jgi:hypothetical protein
LATTACATTTCNECRQAADLLSALSAFMTALGRLLMRLRLLLRAVLHLLIARREWLGIARQVRLLLRFARRITRFVLAHERLGFVVVAVESVIGILLAGPALLLRLLLIVIRVLLTELFLSGGNQAKIMLGMLVVVFSGDRISGSLRVARELDVFFRNMRSGAADFDVGTV